MTKPAWTPGPWACRSSSPAEGFEYYRIVGPRDGRNTTRKKIGTVNGPQSGTQQANALLIAAAPKLYEALADLLSHTDGKGIPPLMLSNARGALAKARGEQP